MSKLHDDASPTVRKIHRRMIQANLTPTELAAAVGAGQTYFHDLFAGRSKRPQLYLEAIARLFKCSVEDLANPGVTESTPEIPSEHDLEEAALIAFWRMLSRKGRRRVMEVVIAEARRIAAERPPPED